MEIHAQGLVATIFVALYILQFLVSSCFIKIEMVLKELSVVNIGRCGWALVKQGIWTIYTNQIYGGNMTTNNSF